MNQRFSMSFRSQCSLPGRDSTVYWTRLLVLLALMIMFPGCAKKKPPEPTFSYETKGIRIQFRADEKLNEHENKSHTLKVIVYQLSAIDPFNNLLKSKDGIRQLLEGKPFDATAVAVDTYFLQPRQQQTKVLDRAQDAQWVGVVAGYFDLTPGLVSKSFEIPVIFQKKGIIIISRREEAIVGHLLLHLYFGPYSIHEVSTY